MIYRHPVTKTNPHVKTQLRTARSGAARQNAYRKSRGIVSIDITGPAAEKLRSLRDRTGETTEMVLLRALEALQELLVMDLSVGRPVTTAEIKDGGASGDKSTHGAIISSPGDITGKKPGVATSAIPPAATRDARKGDKNPKDVSGET